MDLTYLSVCSGIEAASVAWKPLGWKPLAFSEIAEFPSEVLKYHYPDVPNLGDITKFDEWDSSYKPDVFIGGIPCFTSDTLILTKDGLKPIYQVTESDWVWTHRNRWRKVLKAWKSGKKDTIKVHTSMTEVTCTRNHPFYTLKNNTKRFKPVNHNGYFTDEEFYEFDKLMEWTNAEDLSERFVTFPRMTESGEFSEIFDVLATHFEKELSEMTIYKHSIVSPAFCGGLDIKEILEAKEEAKIVFKDKPEKMKMFNCLLAIVAHLHGAKISNDGWADNIRSTNGYSFARAGIKNNKKKVVYNIEVEEDNSYVANGIIVHNCQAYSVAGLRQGLNDAKGRGKPLMFSYLGIIKKYRPRYVIFENVPGILTQDNGAAFNTLLEGLSLCGYNDISWRVINAEDFGVAQERNRLFLVASAGTTACSQRILFKQTWMSRDFGPNGEQREGDSAQTQNGSGKPSGFKFGVSIEKPKKENRDDYPLDIWEIHNGEPRLKLKKSVCMIARWGTGGNNVPIVEETKSYTYNNLTMPKNIPTVRKLTPEECEKLQAFPIGYTKIPYKCKSANLCPTAKRYQALGNSMCTNVIRWLGERIEKVEEGLL